MKTEQQFLVNELGKLLDHTVREVSFYDGLCLKLSFSGRSIWMLHYQTLRREHTVGLYMLLCDLDERAAGRSNPVFEKCGQSGLISTPGLGDDSITGSIHKDFVLQTLEKYQTVIALLREQEYYVLWLLKCHIEEIDEVTALRSA